MSYQGYQDEAPQKRFRYHTPSTSAIEAMNELRRGFGKLATSIVANADPSRERSLALMKLEEASMWANKAVTHRDPHSVPEPLE